MCPFDVCTTNLHGLIEVIRLIIRAETKCFSDGVCNLSLTGCVKFHVEAPSDDGETRTVGDYATCGHSG